MHKVYVITVQINEEIRDRSPSQFDICSSFVTGTVLPELFHRNYSISACAISFLFFGSLMAREKTLYFSVIMFC